MLEPIRKQNLADDAIVQIRNLIILGRLRPGAKLVERDLGRALQISRTPIREALKALQEQGLVSQRGKSLEVPGYDAQEIDEIYPLIANLECFLLRTGVPLTAAERRELRRINAAIHRNRGKIEQQIPLDIAWHACLVGTSSNRKARVVLASLRELAARYDCAYATRCGQVADSVTQHERIVQLLEQGDVSTATQELEAHWLENLPALKAMFS